MNLRSERNRVFDREAWIERGVTVLKHHLRLAAKFFERKLTTPNRYPVKNDVAVIGCDEIHQQTSGCRLSAARLADHAKRFTFADHKVDAIHGAYDTATSTEHVFFQRKVLDQVFNHQQGLRLTADIRIVFQIGIH